VVLPPPWVHLPRMALSSHCCAEIWYDRSCRLPSQPLSEKDYVDGTRSGQPGHAGSALVTVSVMPAQLASKATKGVVRLVLSGLDMAQSYVIHVTAINGVGPSQPTVFSLQPADLGES
jgi:hypothetical protein